MAIFNLSEMESVAKVWFMTTSKYDILAMVFKNRDSPGYIGRVRLKRRDKDTNKAIFNITPNKTDLTGEESCIKMQAFFETMRLSTDDLRVKIEEFTINGPADEVVELLKSKPDQFKMRWESLKGGEEDEGE